MPGTFNITVVMKGTKHGDYSGEIRSVRDGRITSNKTQNMLYIRVENIPNKYKDEATAVKNMNRVIASVMRDPDSPQDKIIRDRRMVLNMGNIVPKELVELVGKTRMITVTPDWFINRIEFRAAPGNEKTDPKQDVMTSVTWDDIY